MMELRDVVLPRRAVPQPHPTVCPGGDCGACCIAGVLGISVAEAYDLQDKDCRASTAKDVPVPFSWYSMIHALKCYETGYPLHDGVLDSAPLWPWEISGAQTTMGLTSWVQGSAWWNYVRMGLCGGFYGVCHMDIEGKGPLSSHNHWVVICGARIVRVPIESVPGAARLDSQILVSCSARYPDGQWRDTFEFLEKYGGFNIVMVRPKNQADVETKP